MNFITFELKSEFTQWTSLSLGFKGRNFMVSWNFGLVFRSDQVGPRLSASGPDPKKMCTLNSTRPNIWNSALQVEDHGKIFGSANYDEAPAHKSEKKSVVQKLHCHVHNRKLTPERMKMEIAMNVNTNAPPPTR